MENTSPRDARVQETTDLAFAAYALMSGLEVRRAEECRRGKANEYSFGFDDPEGRWTELHVAFANSEALRFDNSVRSLKKLCKRGNARPR